MIKNFPQKNKDQVRIEVTFEVDENFIFTITSKELSSNLCKISRVIINEDLSSNEIMVMIHVAKFMRKRNRKKSKESK